MVWHYCFPKALRDRDELAEYSKSHEELNPRKTEYRDSNPTVKTEEMTDIDLIMKEYDCS